jgi:hypothetical protein
VLLPRSDNDFGQVGNGTELKKALINHAMMDVAFSGKPLACNPDYCDYLQTLFEWRKVQSPNGKEAGNHKYIIDVRDFCAVVVNVLTVRYVGRWKRMVKQIQAPHHVELVDLQSFRIS